MDQKNEKIELLLLKLDHLLVRQQEFEEEIKALKEKVQLLQGHIKQPVTDKETIAQSSTNPVQNFPPRTTPMGAAAPASSPPSTSFTNKFSKKNLGKSDFEKFIGANLISKIGILILIIGVAIGAKLAIDKGLVTPLTRIIFGYSSGVVLIGFALKLKAKYESYSAVLLSGAIAILYFISYAAYAYYQLIPQGLTFGLMVLFTGFTVIAATKYNQQIIALIGLVGAYAIPFLLSDGTGNVVVLFTYIAIINVGILVLSFLKYWKLLFYTSFTFTWVIYLGWRIPLGHEPYYVNISLIFAGIYFLIFYVSSLAYKTIKKEAFVISDVILLLLNSFIFYGIGYDVLNLYDQGKTVLGLFTLVNALVHFAFGLIIYKRKLADKSLFYFIVALVITFLTMAVPVQFDGSWVTIFWSVEAAILFYLRRLKNISLYEKLSLPLVFLAFISLVQDWGEQFFVRYSVNVYTPIKPFLNVNFWCSVIFCIAFLILFLTSRKAKMADGNIRKSMGANVLAYAIPSILILAVYGTFRMEIDLLFENLYQVNQLDIEPESKGYSIVFNENYRMFGTVCGYVYTLLFASALTYLNLKKLKSKALAVSNLVINLLVILTFLTHGLFVLSELREAYIAQDNKYFSSGITNIIVRYIAFSFFALLIGMCYELSRSALFRAKLKTAFDYVLYLAILWILSSELLNILALNGLKTGYKLGLSILWGVYALILIGIGLWKDKKYLRIGAIVLFGITLIKLFFYDVSELNTISKTIVFVSLGILLLIISFLYNKYKHLINDDESEK